MESDIIDKKKYCSECENNFYNGNNPFGIKECWSFKNSKIVWKKKVSINQVPPWNQKPIRVLNCYREKGYVFVNKDVVRRE